MSHAPLYDGLLPQLLHSSLAFQVSLASKELFHSNLLSYALERWPKQLANLFPLTDASNVTVVRELKLEAGSVVDMCVEVAGTPTSKGATWIVIEIKFKSLPDTDQLRRYAESAKVKRWQSEGATVHCILVSPTAPVDLASPWRHVSFDSLFDAMSCMTDDIRKYEVAFLHDYASAFREVLKLVKRFQQVVGESAPPTAWCEIVDAAGHAHFQQGALRIFDLFNKVVFDALAVRLRRLLEQRTDDEWRDPVIEVSLAPRSHKGLLDIRLTPRNSSARWGIQIEGGHYRHFVTGIAVGRELATEEDDWLNQQVAVGDGFWTLTGLSRPSKNGNRGDPRSYNIKDGKRFMYRQWPIPSDATVDQVIEVTAKDYGALAALFRGQ